MISCLLFSPLIALHHYKSKGLFHSQRGETKKRKQRTLLTSYEKKAGTPSYDAHPHTKLLYYLPLFSFSWKGVNFWYPDSPATKLIVSIPVISPWLLVRFFLIILLFLFVRYSPFFFFFCLRGFEFWVQKGVKSPLGRGRIWRRRTTLKTFFFF